MVGPSRVHPVVVLGWLLLLVAASACDDKLAEAEENARLAAATSSADATAAVVQEPWGFRLDRPAAGWKMLHPEDAAALVPGALAGALAPEEMIGVVLVTPTTEQLEAHTDQLISGLALEDVEVELLEPTPLAERQARHFLLTGTAAGVALRFGGLIVLRDGYAYELLAWGRVTHTAADGSDFTPFQEAFALLDSAPTASAAASTAASRASRGRSADDIGPRYALRDGVFRSFEHRVSLSPPDGWRARVRDNGAAVELEHQKGELSARLQLEPSTELDRDGYHRLLRERLSKSVRFDARLQTEPKMDDDEARVSSGSGTGEGADFGYLLTTAVHTDAALALIVWGARQKMIANAAAVAALGDAIASSPGLRATEAKTSSYRDHRFGFALPPPEGWQREILTPSSLAAGGTLVRWQDEGRWIGVAAICLKGGVGDRAWMTAFLEQLLRDAYGPLARGPMTRAELQVAGVPAAHLSWQATQQRVDALLLSRRNTVFALLTVDSDRRAFEQLARNFTLLP